MHKAVLLQEVLENLGPAPGKIVLDCTVGCGGHAGAILERITPGGRLIGIDRDSESLEAARKNLDNFDKDLLLVQGNFKDIKEIFVEHGLGEVDGVLFDLGISSFQLEKAKKGFSIKNDGPLDMRMDDRIERGAGEFVNDLDERELGRVLKDFGEERWHRRIARAIVAARPITTTRALAETVTRAVPARFRHGRIHPATRTFQALRIAVNDELGALESALMDVGAVMKKGGRLAVISFHSLEDRIVKNRFKAFKGDGTFATLTKKPVTPGPAEIRANPRSRSAKLRVAQKL